MKVVVTGGSGRIGTYVVRELAGRSHEVTAFDRVPPTVAGVRWLKGDVEDFGEVIAGLKGADVVVHLAAYSMPYRDVPDHVLFRTNVMATYHVHEAAYLLGVRRVVSTSSGAVVGWTYGTQQIVPKYLPLDEAHPVMPHDPYGLSKLCGEEIARSYTIKCGMETIAFRPAWVVVPEEAAQLRQRGGRQPKKFDVCTYIDVRDLAVAYRQAVELPGLKHEILYTIADDSTSSEPLCELLPRLMPAIGDMAKTLTGTRPGISNEKAKRVLQWQPRHSWRVAEPQRG